jgi:hypothetical protein
MTMNTPIQLPPDVTPANKNLMVAFPVTLSDGTTSLVQAVVLADMSGNAVGTLNGGLAVGNDEWGDLLRDIRERLDILIDIMERNG